MYLEKHKLSIWLQPVSSLDDRPKLTAMELKATFDANTNQLKPAIKVQVKLDFNPFLELMHKIYNRLSKNLLKNLAN